MELFEQTLIPLSGELAKFIYINVYIYMYTFIYTHTRIYISLGISGKWTKGSLKNLEVSVNKSQKGRDY